jgi:nucleotide-binding universal stress UspA family protein
MKVLLATDGSKYSEDAAWLVAHLPHSEPLELTILFVTQLLNITGAPGVEEWYQRSIAAENERAAEACKRIEQMFAGANCRTTSVVAQGNPSETILNEAEARAIDLIVLGAVGHSNIDRMLLGSVSDFVATHAHCSVLVVRPTGLKDRGHKSLKVCVAYDGSTASEHAISQLQHFGWGAHTHFDVVNIFTTPQMYTDIPVQFDTEEIRMATQRVAEKAAVEVRRLGGTANPHTVDSAHAGEGIIRFAREHATDLIVMGDTGRGMLTRFLLGSTSKYTLRHAPCSVWIQRKRK